jgi:3-mercaptopyruvate sulfurtransferase SseA
MNSTIKTARVAVLPFLSKVLSYCFLLAIEGCLLLAQPSMAAEGIKGNLVNVAWLEKNLGNADVLVLDASPGQIYTVKHIPGALSVDFLAYGFPERSDADMEQRYQSWGISPGKKIVMYDQGGTYYATMLLFSLYYHGFPATDLFVLDGGLSKWQAQGLPVTKDALPQSRVSDVFRTKFTQVPLSTICDGTIRP